MDNQLIICIPGRWENREDFLKTVVALTSAEYMFAGTILAHLKAEDHVELDFCEFDDHMQQAFTYAGQGRISDETLEQIGQHTSVVYVYFPLDMISQRLRLLKFTELLSQIGGIAIKLENSGIAHEWERWLRLLRSENLFDLYCSSVVLISDEYHYYSCGMHSFGLPDCQISRSFNIEEAAEIMNQFNYYEIVEKPRLDSGHTFGMTATSPRFLLIWIRDERHDQEDLFYNPNGLWDIERA